MKKPRLSVYLDPEMMAQLAELADQKQQPKSLIAEAAIMSFLTPDDADRREAALARRLDLLTRQGERLNATSRSPPRPSLSSSGFGSPSPHRFPKARNTPPRRKGVSASTRSCRRWDDGSQRVKACCASCRLTD